jgi:hypothetical protein
MITINEDKPFIPYKNESMDLFEDIKNLSEARDLLAMIQNQPQVICEQY